MNAGTLVLMLHVLVGVAILLRGRRLDATRCAPAIARLEAISNP